jgi:uracil-DNA glycosylase
MFNYGRSIRLSVLGDMVPAAIAISAQVVLERSSLNTQNAAHQLSALLAWYQEMGVSVAVGEDAIDWRQRGDVAPGAAFAMIALAGVGGAPQAAVARAARSRLEAGRDGAQVFEPPRGGAAPREHAPSTPVRGIVARKAGDAAQSGNAAKVSARTLIELRAELEAFEGCGLKATAKSLCFSRGADKARVMVIGEAPGRDEDLAGTPFAGQVGQLLNVMLGAIGMGEADVHITNVVYWRPPGNRTPTAQETAACAPFLMRQIELVAPDFVLILGGIAAKQLLGTSDGIMKIRGKWRTISSGGREIQALATLHPAYVLKVPASKRQVWRDLLTLKLAVSG